MRAVVFHALVEINSEKVGGIKPMAKSTGITLAAKDSPIFARRLRITTLGGSARPINNSQTDTDSSTTKADETPKVGHPPQHP